MVVVHLTDIMHLKVQLFQYETCIVGILKFGFTCAVGGTVNCDAKNIVYRVFAMYLLSCFVEIKKNVIIKFRLKCTISCFNKCGIGPDRRIHQ